MFKFNDETELGVLNKLKENLDGRNIQYTAKTRESIKSEYITSEERKSFLTTLRGNLINEGKEGTKLYNKVLSAINRDAEALGISPNEYIQVDVSEQPSSSQGFFIRSIAQFSLFRYIYHRRI